MNKTNEKPLKITDLVPYKNNPKRHPQDQIEKIKGSILAFGFRQAIVVDQENVIVIGHARFEAAKQLGFEEIRLNIGFANKGDAFVPVLRVTDLTPVEINALRIADNKLNEGGEWIKNIVIQELEGLDLRLQGLTGCSLDMLLKPKTEDDDVPEIPETTDTKIGDIFKLGSHTIMCGDSTKKEDVKKLMDNMQADLFLTDPPYGVSYTEKLDTLNRIGYKNKRDAKNIMNDDLNISDMENLWYQAFKNAHEVCKSGACFYMYHAGTHSGTMSDVLIKSGWNIKQQLIWVKNAHVLSRSDYHYQHEPVFYGWKQGAPHKFYGNGKCKTTVWNFDRPQKSDLHPTMKPVELLMESLLNSTKAGDSVLDLFLGSGSTLIAAEKSKRVCFGMEMDPKYVDVVVKRWEEFTGSKRLKVA